jgi:hypothetical protein
MYKVKQIFAHADICFIPKAMPYTMLKKLYRFVAAALLAWLVGCAGQPPTKVITKQPMTFPVLVKKSQELDVGYIGNTIKANDCAIGFSCGISRLYGREYFMYLDKKDSLVFIDMESQRIYKTDIKFIVHKLDEYTIGQFEGNHLFLLNNEKKNFYHCNISKDFSVHLVKEINLNSTDAIGKTNFRVSPDASRFVVLDSLLFANYSKAGNKNFIGKTALMGFNLNEPHPNPSFILPYPDKYDKERIYLSEVLFTPINDSCIAFAFFQSDVIGIYNMKTNTAVQTTINRKEGYLHFDEQKERNLGYVSKYLQTNESNYKLFSDSAQRMYLFKRLAKAQKTDTTVMECYVFDAELNPIHSFKLDHDVPYCYIYKYQKGFLAFTKDLTKAYYYAF